MKAWEYDYLGAVDIHEISKNKFFCKILDLVRTGKSEIARKRPFCQGCVGKSRSHEDDWNLGERDFKSWRGRSGQEIRDEVLVSLYILDCEVIL